MEFNREKIDRIREILIERKQNIAVAESVTAGFLQAALASGEYASEFFEGGITAYNIDQKVKHLHIDRKEGEACNCVSPAIAGQMAAGVQKLFGVTWGLSVTGYATPVEEGGFKLFAYYAICENGRVCDTGRVEAKGEIAQDAQVSYVNDILSSFLKILEQH